MSNSVLTSSGGNQRDLARAKNLKKNEATKKNDDGLTPQQRRERWVHWRCIFVVWSTEDELSLLTNHFVPYPNDLQQTNVFWVSSFRDAAALAAKTAAKAAKAGEGSEKKWKLRAIFNYFKIPATIINNISTALA